MEIRGRRFGSLECVVQPEKFGWVGLDSLTDRRESVGTEDGGGIGDDDTGRDADGDRLLGVETRGAGPEGLCGFNKTMAQGRFKTVHMRA